MPNVKARYVIHPLYAICTRVHKATVYPPSCIPDVTVCNTLYGTSIKGGQQNFNSLGNVYNATRTKQAENKHSGAAYMRLYYSIKQSRNFMKPGSVIPVFPNIRY